jgi:hypothetical protein
MSADFSSLLSMDIVTVSAVAGSVASCLTVVPLGIAGVKRIRKWWQRRQGRRMDARLPQVIRTTVDSGGYIRDKPIRVVGTEKPETFDQTYGQYDVPTTDTGGGDVPITPPR